MVQAVCSWLLPPEFRLEWLKTYARQARWKEEVALLREEIRRVLASLEWRSDNWLSKGASLVIFSLTTCPYQLEGLRAYACRQADIFDSIRNHFLGIWEGLERPREHLTEPTYAIDSNGDAMDLDMVDVWPHALPHFSSSLWLWATSPALPCITLTPHPVPLYTVTVT